jgi:hypothetical protein
MKLQSISAYVLHQGSSLTQPHNSVHLAQAAITAQLHYSFVYHTQCNAVPAVERQLPALLPASTTTNTCSSTQAATAIKNSLLSFNV